ncbi:hypothetical protein [Paenibacillus artemisiicola]|nr:hypothetical protein [Paenibacillus artemisiicola]
MAEIREREVGRAQHRDARGHGYAAAAARLAAGGFGFAFVSYS